MENTAYIPTSILVIRIKPQRSWISSNIISHCYRIYFIHIARGEHVESEEDIEKSSFPIYKYKKTMRL